MKIKNIKLMLLALMTMGSISSYADTLNRLIDNVMYQYDNTVSDDSKGTEAKPFAATVKGVKGTELTTVSIDKVVNFTNDLGDKVYLKVTGFESEWMNAVTDLGTKDVKATLTTLTIDATNMKAAGLNDAFKTLTKLETLTISGPLFSNISSLTSRFDDGNKASLKTLDISGLTICTNIDDNAFDGYAKLATVTLPANLVTIGKEAFKGTALTAITIPAKVTSIGASAFEDLEDLATADLSGAEALETIGAKAFSNTGISEVVIPEAVETIGVRAFQSNESLATVTINAELTSIPDFCFLGSAVETITIPETVESIGKYAFRNTALTSIDIPEAVTSIGAGAFQVYGDAEATLTEVTGMEGVTVLEKEVFKGNTLLASIALSEDIVTVGANALEGTQITSLNLPNCTSFDATALGKAATDRAENTTLETVVLGDCAIAEYTFANCTALKSFTWGEEDANDNTIAENAFYNCAALKDVYYELDEDVEVSNVTINVNAFVGCAQFVKIHTSYNYAVYALANDGEPLNAKFDFAPEAYTIKTVADKGNTSIAYNKFNVPYNGGTGYSYEIDPADVAGVYSIYVDESIAYFQSLRKHNGKYVVTPGDCVIIKTEGEKEVEATRTEDNFKCSLIDEVFTLEEDITLAAFQADVVDNPSYLSSYGGWYNDDSSNALKSAGYPDNGMSLYRLTNTAGAGFGFTRYTGTTLKAEQFFILADAPEAARLQTVWLDENGNVEGEATAIQKVETAAENVGEIYNLQGVRVNGAQKGLYIQNGKKFIVK